MFNWRSCLKVLFVLPALLASVESPGAVVNTPAEAIVAAAEAYAREHIAELGLAKAEIRLPNFDSRLKLPDCNGELQVNDTGGGLQRGRLMLRVACGEGSQWARYVPVTVEYQEQVFRFRRNLARGHIIATHDLERVWVAGHSIPPGKVIRRPDQVIGMELQRAVMAGSWVDARMVGEKALIRKGQEVAIVARGRGMVIRMDGMALGDGRMDELIKVKNLSSGKDLEARVRSAGEVEVAW
jgi:flagellar basal body P-ring formation protein FlgA